MRNYASQIYTNSFYGFFELHLVFLSDISLSLFLDLVKVASSSDVSGISPLGDKVQR